ncbi:hypothetical protein N7507_009738 [Penicillium longicatenatum]|nr:hypothetical protein N7507_009738 [Penicillium longicatenatum]
MDQLTKIAYCLDAAGGAMSEQGMHLLYEKNGELTEEVWEFVRLLEYLTVGNEIKPGAPAAYLWIGVIEHDDRELEGEQNNEEQDKRIVFSIADDHTLRYYLFNNHKDNWEEQEFSYASHIHLASGSGLTGGLGPDGPAIFFTGENGKLQTLVMKDDIWELGDLGPYIDPMVPRPGSPLSITPVEDGILVFFIGDNDMLHYLAINPQTGTWQDHWLDHIILKAPVSRFKVFRDLETKLFEAYFLSQGEFIRFSGEGGEGCKKEVGQMNGRELIKTVIIPSYDDYSDDDESLDPAQRIEAAHRAIRRTVAARHAAAQPPVVLPTAITGVEETLLWDLVTRTEKGYGLKSSQKMTRTIKNGDVSTIYHSRVYPF